MRYLEIGVPTFLVEGKDLFYWGKSCGGRSVSSPVPSGVDEAPDGAVANSAERHNIG